MTRYYYKGQENTTVRKYIRLLGLGISAMGFLAGMYFFFPLVSWQIYFAPVFASQSFTTPIPNTTVLSSNSIQGLFRATAASVRGVDYTNAENWYPSIPQEHTQSQVATYTLSIPKINIQNAVVSTIDNNLQEHLVNYGGTAVPPNKGNAVIFGHSTLPQLYNPKDYKTIFANAHKLKVDDLITVNVNNIGYTYKIITVSVVEPEDTSVLSQDYNDRYLTIITCTPPGTIWKRLILKARLESI